jgi:AcrR family transcriptional regulator
MSVSFNCHHSGMVRQSGKSSRLSAPARREQLLDVTARLAADRGFHAISIEAISARAGVTRALVYNHFRDLHELLEAVIDRETSRALAQVSETTLTNLSEGDPRELMLDALDAYLNAIRSSPTTWRLVLMPPEGAPPTLHAKIADGRAAVLERLSRAVEPLTDRGTEPRDAELTARVLSAISDEYARLLLTDPDRFPPQRLLQHARWWLARTPAAHQSAAQPPKTTSGTLPPSRCGRARDKR